MGIVDYIAIVSIAILFLCGTPLSVTFGIGSVVIMLHTMNVPLANVSQVFFTTMSSYPMLAMPFFILAGNLILWGGGMTNLRDFMNRMVGHLPGGMAVAICVFAAFLGSISGSATACLAIMERFCAYDGSFRLFKGIRFGTCRNVSRAWRSYSSQCLHDCFRSKQPCICF